ncbi:MAG: DUF504 domain-containing protein [Thermoplasmatota archaeon]
MKTVRSVLNELKWRPGSDFSKVRVDYVHRGEPGGVASLSGADILSLEPWMMVVRRSGASAPEGAPEPGRVAIPYHRVVRVVYDSKVVMERAAGRAGGAGGGMARMREGASEERRKDERGTGGTAGDGAARGAAGEEE